jgi:diguanylate cyclase
MLSSERQRGNSNGRSRFAQTAGRWRHGELPGIKHSELPWLQHGGDHLESAPELEQICLRIEKSKIAVLPPESRRNPGDASTLMKEIEAGIARSSFAEAVRPLHRSESGRDALTRLLNCRFLPAVLTREWRWHGAAACPRRCCSIDTSKINDTYGHTETWCCSRPPISRQQRAPTGVCQARKC